MESTAVEQLWQVLSDSGLALVCVREPQCPGVDLMSVGDEAVGELTWPAREAEEIAEQYRCGNANSGTPVP
ncbi:hypothetical protein ACFWAY_22090 [Rhodococcus sp. NPDC059968]|uniref:hypothetical protein n=1 Tax=Rhodococcus sp. NPDC059968 TaxID=3347017 RepID=UPI00366E3834